VSQLEAQEINPKNQTFQVSDFKYYAQEKDWSLDINFNLKMSQSFKNPYKYPYTLQYSLFENDKKVHQNSKKVYAQEKDNEDLFAGFVSIKIPYDELNLISGTHSLVLKMSASYHKHHFTEFFNKEITIKIPKLFDYDEQVFSIDKYQLSVNSSVFKTPGILIKFTSTAKFTQNQIKGVKDNPFIGEYLFVATLTDLSTEKRINFYNPKTGNYNFSVNELTKTHQIFIPFNELQLAAKNQKVSLKLRAYTKDKDKQISEVLTKEISFKQPVLDVVNFNLIKARVKYKKYDPSNVFGRVFTSTKSNVGKGNPDVYWELRTGDFVKFSSETMDNSFDAKAQKIKIWVTGKDKLKLIFWDEDVFNDDWIETIHLNPKKGLGKKKIYTKSKNLDVLNFEYSKG
jgi:hypothetical protein